MNKKIALVAVLLTWAQFAQARVGTRLTCESSNYHYGFRALLDWRGTAELYDQFLYADVICRRYLLSELNEIGTAKCVGQWDFGSDDIAVITFSKSPEGKILANFTTPYRKDAVVECTIEQVELGPL